MGADDPAHAAPPFDPDDLVRHSRFVKSLARDLARDDDEADELAARTFEAALARRPTGGGSLRVWLRRVVSRLFLRTRRDEARRRRREEAAAPREATAATVDDVARLELEREVAAAFASLAEPYRTTLFLRCYDDLKPREISARMGVPVETVQTRTKRGLARLRAALDARHGGRREAWHAGAVALAAKSPMVVAAKLKVALAAAGVVLLAGGGWLATKVRGEGTRGDAERTGAAVSIGRVAVAASTSSGDELSRKTEASREPTADGPLPLIAGVVVDVEGAPVEGAAIVPAVINRDDARNCYVEEFHVDRAKASAVAWSDANGRFRVEAMPRDCVGIHVLREGFGVGEAYELGAERTENQELRVVLPKPSRAFGRIRDSEGRPIRFASIAAIDTDYTRLPHVARNLQGQPGYTRAIHWSPIHARASADGSFELATIPSAEFRIIFESWGHEAIGRSAADALAPLDVVLRRHSLLVDVDDARTHAPIEDAHALIGLAGGGGSLIDVVPARRESFAWEPDDISPRNRLAFAPETARTLRWRKGADADADRLGICARLIAPGHRTRAIDVDLSFSQEPPHMTVELEPGEDEPSLTGQVLVGARAHVDVRFLRRDGSDPALQQEFPIRSVDCDADGRFAIAGLPPATYRLFVRAPDSGQYWTDVVVPVHDVTIELKPAAILEARVVNDSGEGVPDVSVFVQTTDEQRSWIGLTDANGTAVFDELPEGDVQVAAFRYSGNLHLRPQTLQWQQLPIDSHRTLVAGERSRIELLLPEKRPALLRVRDARGNPVSDAFVRYAGVHGSADWQEPGFGLDLSKMGSSPKKVESDGTLHLELFPSRYTFEIQVDGIVQRTEVVVTAGGPTEFEIRLPIRGAVGAIHGRAVEFGSGRPMAFARVVWADGDGTSEFHAMGSTETDAEGRFAFERVPAGPVVVAAYGPQESHGSTAKRVGLAENGELTVDLPIGRLHPDDPTMESVSAEITVVDDETGAPIEGAYAFLAADVDGANVYLGELKSGHDGRACGRVTAAATYDVSTGGPFPPKPPFEALYEKARIIVKPVNGLIRATIRLHRKP